MALQYRKIDLKNAIEADPRLEFFSAEVLEEPPIPFAAVRYAIDGEEQAVELRLDLDKRVFIDHLEDEKLEKLIQVAAPRIVAFLGDAEASASSRGMGIGAD